MMRIGFGRYSLSFAFWMCSKMFYLIAGVLSVYHFLDVRAVLKIGAPYCTFIDTKNNYLGPLRHLRVAIIFKIQSSAISLREFSTLKKIYVLSCLILVHLLFYRDPISKLFCESSYAVFVVTQHEI